MRESRLQEIRDREKAATVGPWVCEYYAAHDVYDVNRGDMNDGRERFSLLSDLRSHNAEFIAHARQDIPDLLAYIDWLESVLRDAQNDAAALFDDAHLIVKDLRRETVHAMTERYVLQKALGRIAIAYGTTDADFDPNYLRAQVHYALRDAGIGLPTTS